MKVILVIILICILTYWVNYEPTRDYTNLTVFKEPYPDIAIDLVLAKPVMKWKLSRKRLTKGIE